MVVKMIPHKKTKQRKFSPPPTCIDRILRVIVHGDKSDLEKTKQLLFICHDENKYIFFLSDRLKLNLVWQNVQHPKEDQTR